MPPLTGFFLIVTVLMSYFSILSSVGLNALIISMAVLTGESQKLVAVVDFVCFLRQGSCCYLFLRTSLTTLPRLAQNFRLCGS